MSASDQLLLRATHWRTPLAVGAGTATATAGACALLAWWLRAGEAGSLAALLAATAGLVAASLWPAWLVGSARARLAESRRLDAGIAANAGSMLPGGGAEAALASLRRVAGWPQALATAPIAAAAAIAPWLAPARAVPGDDRYELALAVAAVVAAFPLLVTERRLLTVAQGELPEARPLARLLRVATWVLVAGGCAAAARAHGFEAAAWVQVTLGGLVSAIAGEALLRTLATPFLPVAHAAEARALGDGTLVAVIATRGERGGLGAGFRERFGIDLSRSWALSFLRRAGWGLAGVLAVIAWLTTGLTALGIGERGIYERLGDPVAVLQPGLHAHLPWPFGRVVRTENGQIHELPLGGGERPGLPPRLAADQDPPMEFDRLWERKHLTEGTWLVPGRDGGRQLVSADVRVVWRIGASDGDARDSVYAVASPPVLVRLAAGRLFTRAFAGRGFETLVGEERDQLAGAVTAGLRQELAGTGIDVTAVVIDAIHPPTDAVPAYHAVQEAGISAIADAAAAKGRASRIVAVARLEAATTRDAALAAAAETTATATIDSVRLGADTEAVRLGGNAILIERRLQTMGRALAKGKATVIDHRLTVDGSTLIDLRKGRSDIP
jgi:regulator of protease activity HflC (stomatin/prohibitin superfamily)